MKVALVFLIVVAVWSTVDAANYLGCYRDNPVRDLKHSSYSNNINTPERCIRHCISHGYRYAGVQFSKECWCGSKYGTYGKSTACTMSCSGNNAINCGGVWANAVYDTNYLGCFKDKHVRDLKFGFYSNSVNTPFRCMNHCVRLGYRYAGVQFSRECWCGKKFGTYGKATNCNMNCSGNSWYKCGGSWANSVYDTNFLGCYRDKHARDLKYGFYSNNHNRPSRCIAHCIGLGYKYAGVQYSKECWCGNTYGRYGQATNCNMNCSGNSQQKCGGSWANSVYETGQCGYVGK